MATVQAILVFAAHVILLLSAATICAAVAEAGNEDSYLRLFESSAPSPAPTVAERSLSTGNPSVKNASVNLVVRNMARGSVTFQLETRLGPSSMSKLERMQQPECVAAVTERVVETGQGAVMEGIAVSSEDPVVLVGVTVKTSMMRGPVKKVLQINLSRYFDGGGEELQKLGRRALVLTAVESWRLKSGKYLVIHLGHRKVALSFKL